MSFDKLSIDVISALIFPRLSMIEQAYLSRVNKQCRAAASRYYDRLFSTLSLSANQKQLCEGIKNKNREELKVLIPQLTVADFDRVGGFDILFYAWLMGLNDILDEIFETILRPSCNYKPYEVTLLVTWGIRTFKSLDRILELLNNSRDTTLKYSYLKNDVILWVACQYGHFEVVKRITDCSLEFFVREYEENFTPLTVAHHYGHYQIVRFLMGKIFKSPYSLLESACTNNNIELTIWLLERGVLLTQHEAGNLLHALIHSRIDNHAEVTRLLLEQRSVFSNPTVLDRALWIASRNGRAEMVKVFREKGARLDCVYKSNSLSLTNRKLGERYTTALEEALIKQHYSLMVLLIIEGSDVRVLFNDLYFESFSNFMCGAINYGVTKRQIAIKILENYSLTDKSAERLLMAFNRSENSKEKFNLFDGFVFRSENTLSPEIERMHKVCLPFLHKPSENEPIMESAIHPDRKEKPYFRLLNNL